MPKKPDYASLYTLRKDGRYVGSYTDSSERHFVYDRDPERLWHKLNDPKEPKRITFRQIAEDWQAKHWERVGFKTAEAYTAPLRRLIETYGDMAANEVSAQQFSPTCPSWANRAIPGALSKCTGTSRI